MELNLDYYFQELNSENMKWLLECIKTLPSNLNRLKFLIRKNYLGRNVDNIKLLVEIMKLLPFKLKYLTLDL